MNTKLIFTTSALFTGTLGITIIFLPQETSSYLGIEVNQMSELIFQLIGALYFGFAMLNWMAKGHLAGGIYGRPIIVGNLTHYMIVSLSLIKNLSLDLEIVMLGIYMLYIIFALLFGYIFFTTPKEVSNNT